MQKEAWSEQLASKGKQHRAATPESPLGLCATHLPLAALGVSQAYWLLNTPRNLFFGKPHACPNCLCPQVQREKVPWWTGAARGGVVFLC